MIVASGTVIGSLVVMFLYSIQLTGIFLLFMVVSMLITRIVARKNLKSAAERQETIGELTGIVEEFYNGRDVIKAYNHEHASIVRVKEASAKNAAASQKADFLTNCVNPLIRLLTRLAHVVIAIIAGYEMINGRMSVGVVQAFFQYINQAAEPLTEASFMINSLQAALASAERTFEMLDEEDDAIAAFIRDSSITVISQSRFYAQDSVTDVSKNEYVQLASGVYMQIVDAGVEDEADTVKNNDVVLTRFSEYCIIEDPDRGLYKGMTYSNLDIVYSVDAFRYVETSTSIAGIFTEGYYMQTSYSGGTAVPAGWLVPLPYIRNRAHVRLIVPSKMGSTYAMQSVVPFYYDINYQMF